MIKNWPKKIDFDLYMPTDAPERVNSCGNSLSEKIKFGPFLDTKISKNLEFTLVTVDPRGIPVCTYPTIEKYV